MDIEHEKGQHGIRSIRWEQGAARKARLRQEHDQESWYVMPDAPAVQLLIKRAEA